MLPEEIAEIIGSENFNRLTDKLEDSLTGSTYLTHGARSTFEQVIVEIVALTYKKARLDERYYAAGPYRPVSIYGD